MNPFIKLDHVDFSYENANILSDINLDIYQGEFISILGHNGCGKSTLAKLLNALLLPTSGNIIIDNINTLDENLKYEVRCKVGLILQNPDNQIIASTVEEDVAFGPENLGLSSCEIRNRVDTALKAVSMYDFKDYSVYSLSGGQKQKIAIAGILAMKPKCIVLDESTSMLDPYSRKDLMNTLMKLNKELNITIILITHFMEEAVLADNIIVMSNGKLIIKDTPRKVFSNIKLLKDSKLDIPVVTKLAEILKLNGCNLPKGILNKDEFITSLKTVLEGPMHANTRNS